ncbi:RNA polymerase II degradation factor 1-like [Pararge aegeria]|uniref:Jg4032 protein n=1 Tax=Pararge aegeria aegeria TaxID=348720 RepID=A0A8S4R767_9NEOP|nr:RNA polymerase II degradation factor 1-like [Pararge aegeria]CAH2231971.1 jg4032 [Pararge aegeria aegeria]
MGAKAGHEKSSKTRGWTSSQLDVSSLGVLLDLSSPNRNPDPDSLNQNGNSPTNPFGQNSDQGAQTNSGVKINPTSQQQEPNQQQNQQPLIVHQNQPQPIVGQENQPQQVVIRQPNQPQQIYVSQPNQPQQIVPVQQNQQPNQIIIDQQPNRQGVITVQSNQPAVIWNQPPNQQIVGNPSNQQPIMANQPGQQAIWVTPNGQQTILVGQPNQMQVSQIGQGGQQHGQAILVPKPGENNVYTFIPINSQNNNQNQGVSNGNTIWVPVQS